MISAVRRLVGTSRRSTLVHNTVALYGVFAAGLLLPLVTIPYLARVLRPEGWGVVVFSQSFAAWLTLVLEYGFYLSATREIAKVRSDPQKVARVVAGVQGAKCLLLSVLVIAGVGAYALVPLFRVQPHYLVWAVLAAATQGFTTLWYFQGVERMRGPAAVDVFTRVLAVAGIFLWIHGPEDGWMVLALQAGSGGIGVGLTTYWMYREVPRFPIRLPEAVRMLRSAAGLFVVRGASGAYTQANGFILGLFATTQAVAYFGGAEKIVRAAISLIQPVSQALYPRISHLAVNDSRRAGQLVRLSMLLVGGLGVAIGAGVAFFAPELVRLILGAEYEAAIPVLRAFGLLPPLIAIGTVLGIQWALPFGHDRAFYAFVLAAGILNIVLATQLAPHYGPLGMVTTMVLAEVIVAGGLGWLWWRSDSGSAYPGTCAPN